MGNNSFILYISDINKIVCGVNYGIKKYSELTPDGKKHSTNKVYATLRKGTKVTCKAIHIVDGNTWMQIPSGYICAIYNNKIYVK